MKFIKIFWLEIKYCKNVVKIVKYIYNIINIIFSKNKKEKYLIMYKNMMVFVYDMD